MIDFDAARGALTTMQEHSARTQDKIWSANNDRLKCDDADILTAAIGNERVAEAWIRYFGNLAGVAATSLSVLHVVAVQVDPDCAHAAIERLLTIHAYGLRALAQRAAQRPLLEDRQRVIAYLRADMQAEGIIQFRILFLDAKSYLILDEIMNRGTIDHMPIYPREIMRRALEVYAASIIIVHNHPWGDPSPEARHVEVTRQIIAAGCALGICVKDHLIIGRNGTASFQRLGLLSASRRRSA
ncbi:MAG: JAB domain-containing protein [Candidatus Brevundimonas phytovorans]|nr:JAB domain-containing protein [Brevundimonas sp.]WEK56658.1 MAG: JAB domain-containing protein [Brevundimonas sp.]